MTDYTPTTEQIRLEWLTHYRNANDPDGSAEFDRWLAEVERAAAEKAWDAAGESLAEAWGYRGIKEDARAMNPYREADRG